MKKTFGKTVSAAGLSESGLRLRLEHPRSPHTLPHRGGGYLRLTRYVADTAMMPVLHYSQAGHGHGQGHEHYSHAQQAVQMGGGRLEVEIIHYRGFDSDDGLTLVIDQRGVGGTVPMSWAPGTLITQDAEGEDWHELYELIISVLSLGCLAAVPFIEQCRQIEKGQWYCYGHCWRMAKQATVAETFPGWVDSLHGCGSSLDMTGKPLPANEYWGACYQFSDLLNLLELLRPFVDPAGKVIPTGDCLLSCDDFDSTIQLGINEPGKFGVVPEEPENIWEMCHVIPEIPAGCTIRKLGMSINGGGCAKIGWYSEASSLLASGGSTAAPLGTVQRWPPDPADHATYYDHSTLSADNTAGTIDRTKLMRTQLLCFEVDIPCDGMALTLEIGATVVFEPDNKGISRFVVEVDGIFPKNSAGETIAMAYFTSYEGAAQPTLDMTLDAGVHNLCVYVMGSSANHNAAQILVQNTNGAKRPIYKLSNQVK